MARDFAKDFYNSPAWKECRTAYRKQVGGLCEQCLARGIYTAGVIVHHKVHLTPETIRMPEIALSFENLELLCRDCHAAQHERIRKRWKVDDLGRVRIPPGAN